MNIQRHDIPGRWSWRWWLASFALLLVAGAGVWLQQRNSAGGDDRYDSLIEAAAIRHGIDPTLVKAVIRQESAFDADAVGAAGEIGLMQITAGAWSDYARIRKRPISGPGVMHDPALNIEVGTWYLARGLRQWASHPDAELLALIHYNAGPSRARDMAHKHVKFVIDDISIHSTRGYIRQVLRYRVEYKNERPVVPANGEA